MNASFRNMIGKTFLYHAKQYAIENIEEEEADLYKITTDTRTFRASGAELRKEFLPVQAKNGTGEKLALIRILHQENLPMTDVGKTLIESIEKLKSDPAYIEQARAINDTAKVLIDMRRLQLDLVRTVRGM